jgi:hypothetical protein
MWNFKDDLIKWKNAEIRLMNRLNEMWWYIIQNPNERELDLILCDKWIEVKLDDKSLYTWNFYIEFEYNWKPSWIFREEKIHLAFWRQCTTEKCYIVPWSKLKEYVAVMIDECRANKSLTSCWIRLVENWWNWGRTKWLLIPIKEFEYMSEFIVDILNK